MDERLAPHAEILDLPRLDVPLPPSQAATVSTAADYLKKAGMTGRLPVLHLAGSDAASKRLVARKTADRLGLRLYRITADLIPTQAADLETFSRLWQRESILLPMAIYVDAQDLDLAGTEALAQTLRRFLDRLEGVCFLDAHQLRAGVRETITVEGGKTTAREDRLAWGQ